MTTTWSRESVRSCVESHVEHAVRAEPAPTLDPHQRQAPDRKRLTKMRKATALSRGRAALITSSMPPQSTSPQASPWSIERACSSQAPRN
jgi:hypothetical protein